MKMELVVKRLIDHFGTDFVFVRSEFHIQIQSSKGLNDIWINKYGELKAKIYGNRDIIENCSLESIIGSQKKSHIDNERSFRSFKSSYI